LFSLRHALALTLLSSCSVYDASLLDERADGDSSGGSLAVEPGHENGARGGKGGQTSSGAGKGPVAEAGAPGAAGSGAQNGVGGSGGTASTGSGGSEPAGGSGVIDPGGSSSGGGTPPVPSGADLLDDMEDGNFYLVPRAPRYGFWYVAGDATAGAMLPKIEELVGTLSPARDASTLAVHFTATGFKGWGASVGLSFTDQASKRVKYDAGNATGISFWVRGSVASNAKLRVLFPLPGTDPIYELCGDEEQGQCLDHYATQVTVTGEWQHVTIPFASLHQAGWGAPVPAFDPTEMLGIEWSAGVANLDVWLDDLAMIRP
jgi:hypothetical protein